MPRLLSRRKFIGGILTAPLLAGLYTWRVEPTWVEFVYRPLPIRHLPDALIGKLLIQISDLHIGDQVSDTYLKKVFTQVSALQPDIVVHTGDLVTYSSAATTTQARALLEHFPHGKLGTCVILGNHDYGHQWSHPEVADQLAAVLSQAGCTVLRNETADIAGLQVIGLDDLWAGHFFPQAALARLKPQQAAIVLSHNPDTCDLPVWSNYQGWILSGHTHGGQCKPPFLPAPLLPVRNRRYVAGEYALTNQRNLYINRGLGHLMRVRFNARPEVTVFTLAKA